ncbi:interleukin-3-like [Arvicanthis niloticus]|uniref:interleukin-3-like n=1 Tax=Arvicanthis niloticus TaxID=61156 RepID=UPI001486B7F1|nr:interleukin-3-like [Arvicanthis niloticus]
MVLVSSTTSILSLLLLLLKLFHQGLQAPTNGPLTSMWNCNSIAMEIRDKLSGPELTDMEDKSNLVKETYRRANLLQFLKSQKKYPQVEASIKSNLQILKCCLPASANDSRLSPVGHDNPDDFQKKLRFFVSQLKDLQPVPKSRPSQPTSDSITSHPETLEC